MLHFFLTISPWRSSGAFVRATNLSVAAIDGAGANLPAAKADSLMAGWIIAGPVVHVPAEIFSGLSL
jgi:hypothetical protein